jgi:peptide/nickel transport system substrate-binding protein
MEMQTEAQAVFRKGIVFVLVGLLLMALIGCNAQTGGEEPAATEGEKVLTLGGVKDYKRAVEGRNLVFECLVGVDHKGNPVPKLAVSWDVSRDGKTYVFHLREGVKFHDGTSFDAEAARFALERAASKRPFGRYIDGIEVLDEHTLKVHLKEYYAPFLLDLASGWGAPVVPPQAVEPAGSIEGEVAHYIGTGPFKLVDYKKDEEAVLVRNDDYWGEKPKVDKVIWKTIPDPHAQIIALKAGELDMIGITEHHSSVPYVAVPGLKEAGVNVEVQSYGRYQVLEFNCQREPFSEQKVRMAFNYAIDREKMVRELFDGLAEPAYTITAPWFKYGPSNVNRKFGYDPEKAKQLLAEAGWQDTDGDGLLDKDGRPFTCELLIPAGEANADAVAIFVQSELKKIGVDMKLLILESGAASDRRKKGEYDMFVHHSFCLPSIPGGIAIGQKYHSQSKSWPAAYHSEELDQLIEKAWTTPDESERQKLCDQIWNILHEQAPCIPLYDIVKVVAYRDNVSGFQPAPTMFEMELQNIEVQ